MQKSHFFCSLIKPSSLVQAFGILSVRGFADSMQYSYMLSSASTYLPLNAFSGILAENEHVHGVQRCPLAWAGTGRVCTRVYTHECTEFFQGFTVSRKISPILYLTNNRHTEGLSRSTMQLVIQIMAETSVQLNGWSWGTGNQGTCSV